ncbi:WYL domain-containing protein [Acaricomes phytoseiuli]|uniref:helix-turn-helix transcriptional regulator n=1 Tax=Acaricomes phytoseiuli TaxID=291968 RepID=UPI0022218D90|nr:WYL domain-containing protein [Acaricomes phytoseiuli]MCW1248765.1 WYL domain-containing protein [Acaricomes phytoseiuli]
MSASRTERLLNLLIALLETRYGRSKEFLRENIQAYRESPSEEAFERMFERDKVDLRAMGIPLETQRQPGAFEEDPGNVSYRIPKEKYRLPEIQLTAAEAAALSLAGRLWSQAALGAAASRAVRKIGTRVVGDPALLDGTEAAEPLLEPRISLREPGFEDLLEAASTRRTVRFDYRGREDEKPRQRTVQPWGLGLKYGHWYLVGWDLERQGQRIFRLSRLCSGVSLSAESFDRPEDFSITEALRSLEAPDTQRAEILVRAGRGQSLRDRIVPEDVIPGDEDTAGSRPAVGWDRITVAYGSWDDFAGEVASYGPDARLLAPEDLRAEVIKRFEGVLSSHREQLPQLPDRPAPAHQPRAKTTAQDRLRRLVDLVPFLNHHQGMHVDDVAAEFGISRRDLEADLSLLMVSGLPGGLHGDLMDVTWDDGYIHIADAEELSEAIRLSVEEASALLVGLEALSALPGLSSDSAVRTVMSKISAAAGEAAGEESSPELGTGLGGIVDIRLSSPEQGRTLELLQSAIRSRQQLKLEYLVPHRDELTERIVDPIRVFSQDEAWYLLAWCHSAEAQRTFRVDRIRSAEPEASRPAEVSREQEAVREVAQAQNFPLQLFTPGAEDIEATLLVDASALWVADYYQASAVLNLPETGSWAQNRWVKLLWIDIGSPEWLPRLVARAGGAIRLVAPQDCLDDALTWSREALAGYAGYSEAASSQGAARPA